MIKCLFPIIALSLLSGGLTYKLFSERPKRDLMARFAFEYGCLKHSSVYCTALPKDSDKYFCLDQSLKDCNDWAEKYYEALRAFGHK